MDQINEINDDMSLAVARAMRDSDYLSELAKDIQIPQTIDGMYGYLLDNYLVIPYNRLKFGEKVREIYYEVCEGLYEDRVDTYPSISEISTIIDEENLQMIDNFFSSYGIDERDIEVCKTKYVTDISCGIFGEVKSHLRDYGLYYRKDDIKILDEMELVSGEIHPDQQILIYDFFY